ncbi:WD40 repeat-like protein [Wallemia mellicola]|uniref:WD40 repeat-like protein n=1 Tax=Wallemia mellicola TaxID=1708541 RepID=A0A4T0QHE5_9BASI|nr:WD40 repeat-like protein [Wallemia mellicola]
MSDPQQENIEEQDGQDLYLNKDEMLEEDLEDTGEPMEDDDDEGELEPELDEEQQANIDMINAKDDSIQGFFGHKEPVYAIAIHPNNPEIIVSAGGDDKAHVWNITDGEHAIASLEGHTDSVTSVAFSKDGQFVATGGMDGFVKIWDTSDWSLKVDLQLGDECTLMRSSVPKGDNMNVFSGHTEMVTCGRFTPDGKAIVSSSSDGSLIMWSPTEGTAVTKITANDARFNLDGGITAMAVNPAGTIVVAGGAAGGVRAVNLSNGQVVGSFECHKEGESIEAVAFLPEGAAGQGPAGVVVTAGTDGVLNVIDLTTMRVRNTMNIEEPITVLEFQHQSPFFAVGCVDHKVRMFDARTGSQVKEFEGHSEPVLSVAVSKDGSRIITGSDDGTALVFDGSSTK